jgi:hypothetical protein
MLWPVTDLFRRVGELNSKGVPGSLSHFRDYGQYSLPVGHIQ